MAIDILQEWNQTIRMNNSNHYTHHNGGGNNGGGGGNNNNYPSWQPPHLGMRCTPLNKN